MLALLLLFLDISAAAPVEFDPKKCSMQDGPLRRDWDNALAKKLTPAGMHLSQAAGKQHLLFSTGAWRKHDERSVVLNRDGKTITTLPGEPDAALVEDEGGKLVGVLALHDVYPAPRHLQLYSPRAEPQWKMQPLLDGMSDSATVLLAGDLLIVAHFHRIATGSGLIALDRNTGTPRWKADVEQMMIAHSKYWNDVSLERRGDVIVMRGYEAGGCYLQTFDLKTGKRLSATLPPDVRARR